MHRSRSVMQALPLPRSTHITAAYRVCQTTMFTSCCTGSACTAMCWSTAGWLSAAGFCWRIATTTAAAAVEWSAAGTIPAARPAGLRPDSPTLNILISSGGPIATLQTARMYNAGCNGRVDDTCTSGQVSKPVLVPFGQRGTVAAFRSLQGNVSFKFCQKLQCVAQTIKFLYRDSVTSLSRSVRLAMLCSNHRQGCRNLH
jgi:hypothetical protein